MDYDLTIGLEVHVQLKTKSKMFCSCAAQYFGAEPNSHVCPVCLGLPGALPVANREAINKAYLIGLGLGCRINKFAKFDRKNYFYPDLAKGFQITQFDKPFALGGYLEIEGRKIRLNRAHLEEDTGKLIHAQVGGEQVSLIDFNRSGVPLMEIVSEPDITSPEEAKGYAQKLNLLMKTLGVADADMEKAGMRFDANVSLKPKGRKEYGVKVEIKNINSFRFLEKAIVFEFTRQAEILKKGEEIVQETRGWVESKGITQSQRTKELAPDYRYFPEPDLTNYTINNEQINDLKTSLPILPEEREKELINYFGLNANTAHTIVTNDYSLFVTEAITAYQQLEEKGISPTHFDSSKATKVANWVVGEMQKILNAEKITIDQIKTEPASLSTILYAIDQGKITTVNGKEILKEAVASGASVSQLIEKYQAFSRSLGSIEEMADRIIADNNQAVKDYLGGKEPALFYLVGQLMKRVQGGIPPDEVRRILEEKLKNAGSE